MAPNRYLQTKLVHEYDVRRAEARDASGIVDLLYRIYGYTYQSRECRVYDPERLAELNRSGELESFVAVLPSGQVIGHAAMKPLGPDVYEAGELALDTGAARPEVTVAVARLLVESARARGARKLVIRNVTRHAASQRVTEVSLGFRPGAILLAAHPETLAFRALEGRVGQRESFMEEHLFFVRRPLRVFLPARHAPMVRRLYEALELPRAEGGPGEGDAAPPRHTVIEVALREQWLAGSIAVRTVGQDLIPRVGAILEDFRQGYLRHVGLRLPLDTPHGAAAVDGIERLGFFFAGVDPDDDGRDHAVFTALFDVAVDLGQVRAHGKVARELVEYVGREAVAARVPAPAAEAPPREPARGRGPRPGPGPAAGPDAVARAVHDERLRVAKQLSAGLSHEINNPLNIILGSAYYVKQRLKHGAAHEEAVRHLETIEDEVARVARLLDNLQKFARPEELPRGRVSLARACDDALLLLGRALEGAGLVVSRRHEPDAPEVEGNASQLQEVALQLILNAAQASEPGGEVLIETRREGAGAVLAVRDRGRGMGEETLGRLGEPFFTTREVGQGTGLGLAIVHGIVEAHGGRVDVESAPGGGTTATVRLPAAAPDAARGPVGGTGGTGGNGDGGGGNGHGNGNGHGSGAGHGPGDAKRYGPSGWAGGAP